MLIIKIINFLKNTENFSFLSLYNIKMTSKNIEVTRKEYNCFAENRGIQEPQNMSTKDLLNTLRRYDSRRKVKNNRKKLLKIKPEKIAKIQNISKNKLNKAEKLQNKSIDEL